MMDNLLTPHITIPHVLEPLAQSHEADKMEAALKQVFMEVFEDMVRPAFDRVNLYGMPHRSDSVTVERFTKQEGIAIYRFTSDVYLRELFRAWRARNPRRGLEFLRFYLQMLFPNMWACDQLWHLNSGTYPRGTIPSELPGASFLTSRVAVSIASTSITETLLLQKITPALRSVLAAKLVLLIRTVNEYTSQTVIGTALFSTSTPVYIGTAS